MPVVAGDSGGAPDAVRDNETGYVIDGRSEQALADRVSELLADRSLSKAMGLAGRDWVSDEWSWERRVRELGALVSL